MEINVFSQQDMEKINDFITSWYFRSTNHNKMDTLEQVEYLGFTCERGPKFSVTCGICQEKGHNKRSFKFVR